MNLQELVEKLATTPYGKEGAKFDVSSLAMCTVSHVTADSREVTEGSLFIAVPGTKQNGSDFIKDAMDRGAKAIIAHCDALSEGLPQNGGPIFLACENPRQVLAIIASRFFQPAPASLVAVTGTNGKSSVASFTRQIWTHKGFNAACMGTLGLEAPGVDSFPHPSFGLTTPDPIGLHKYLKALGAYGVTHVSLEASSHGLAQYRVDGLHLRGAGFTNLSQDHMDYHGTMSAYWAAKKRLFQEVLPPDGCAVLNADVPEYSELREICRHRNITVTSYGVNGDLLKIRELIPQETGQILKLELEGRKCETFLPLLGSFQAYNALCAGGLAVSTGASLEDFLATCPHLQGVVGRVQKIGETPSGARVYIDYAHTPDALRALLMSLRPYIKNDASVSGRLILVFGCGGDRDALKRPIMGSIASRLADVVFVTDDNPRSEGPAQIRAEILSGIERQTEVYEMGDRGQAIHEACARAGPQDMVVIAGKGHEQGQLIGHEIVPFDDAVCVRDALAHLWRKESV